MFFFDTGRMNNDSYLLSLCERTHFKIHFELSIKRRHLSSVHSKPLSQESSVITTQYYLIFLEKKRQILLRLPVESSLGNLFILSWFNVGDLLNLLQNLYHFPIANVVLHTDVIVIFITFWERRQTADCQVQVYLQNAVQVFFLTLDQDVSFLYVVKITVIVMISQFYCEYWHFKMQPFLISM